MDRVFIRELRVDTVIGIYDWERKVRQTVSFDLDMAFDIRQAAATDDIRFTLNYKSVSDRIIEYVSGQQFLLLEAMAERVAELIMREFAVPWVRLTLHKPGAVPQARDVGVVIERGEP